MAEIALAFLGSVGSLVTGGGAAAAGATAAGGAVAGAAAAGASTIGVSSTVLSVLGGVATAGSVLMQMAAGNAAEAESGLQESMALTEARSEAAASAARAVEIRREALQKIGAARVAFAASGIDLSSDQLTGIEDSIEDDAKYQTGIERANQRRALLMGKLRAGAFTARGANAAFASNAGALTTAAGGMLDIVKRG